MILIYTSIILTSSIIGTIFLPKVIHKYEHYLHYVNSFSGSVLFSTALIHLLPELSEYHLSEYPYHMVFVTSSFLLLMFLEKYIFHIHHHTVEIDSNISELTTNIITVLAISAHSFIAGISLGLSDSNKELNTIFISIISHKIFAAYAIGCKLYNSKSWNYYIPTTIFILITPIGVIVGYFINDVSEWCSLILESISCGTFLYIGSTDIIEEHEIQHHNSNDTHHRCSNTKLNKYGLMLSIILGVVFISLINIQQDQEH